MARTFGVEIECGHDIYDSDTIRHLIENAGFRTNGYVWTKSRWGVGYDGSGIEVKSPVFSGVSGYKELTRMMDFLHDQGCWVSRRDGMHVHVGASELKDDEEACTALARSWYNNQGLIARMCSSHRINGGYSSRVTEKQSTKLGKTIKTRPRYGYGYYYYQGGYEYKNWGGRYKALNFTSLEEHETVEFRLHEGCLDASKACAWIRFCVALVDHAITTKEVLTCARSKTALLTTLGLPQDARAALAKAQRQMPRYGKVR